MDNRESIEKNKNSVADDSTDVDTKNTEMTKEKNENGFLKNSKDVSEENVLEENILKEENNLKTDDRCFSAENDSVLNKKSDTGSVWKQLFVFVTGEVVVSLVTVLIYVLIDRFTYKVVTGLVLGSAVVIANFFILILSVNSAINKFIKKRGNAEMTEEEADKFAKENESLVQGAIVKSFVLRTILILAVVVCGLALKWFDVIATVVPILMYRPILYVSQFIERKREK